MRFLSTSIRPARFAPSLACVAALLSVPACKLVEGAVNVPGQVASGLFGGGTKRDDRIPLTAVQAALMRFADTFAARLSQATEDFALAAGTEEARERALHWTVEQSGAAFVIASGKNAIVDMLDMLVLVSLGCTLHREYWIPKVYGEADRPMLEAFQKSEEDLWALARPVLSANQLEELQCALADWRTENPDLSVTASVRLPDFQGIVNARRDSRKSSEGLGELLRIDPFSGLEPTKRELEQTRMFAERALYYAQRMPLLLSKQVELLGLRLGNGLVGNVEKMRDPSRAIMADARDTIEAGTKLSTALTETTRTLDEFVAHVTKKDEADATKREAPREPSRPFDIKEYGETATQIGGAARDVQGLLGGLDEELPNVQRVLDEVTARGQLTIDHAFKRGLTLGAILIVVAAITVLVVRWISNRWLRPAPTLKAARPTGAVYPIRKGR